MNHRGLLPRVMSGILIALLLPAGGALAQTSSGPVNAAIHVVGNECVPDEDMTVWFRIDYGPITVPAGDTDSDMDNGTSLVLAAENAPCTAWSIGASLTDFALDTDTTTTFPASTLLMSKADQGFDNPMGDDPQPDWVLALDTSVTDNTGTPTMPSDPVTFTEGTGAANSSSALLTANTATYGSPGTWYAYYNIGLTGVSTSQADGDYTSTMTISVNGGDD